MQNTGNTTSPSFTDHAFMYIALNGLSVDQAISKAEGDLHGTVPIHIKELARKELQNIGRTK